MKRALTCLIGGLATAAAWAAAGPDQATAGKSLTAAEIVRKNVAARGGLEAWRKIDTMVSIGHIDTVDGPGSTVSFMLEAKRPNKTHFEVRAENQQLATRIYNGADGWNLRRNAAAEMDLRPYSLGELKFAHDSYVIDGPLIDYRAKGVAVALDGVDQMEQGKAYRLKVTLPSGAVEHVWIDAQTFLDVKLERPAAGSASQSETVTVYYRSYQAIAGVQIPVIIETGAGFAKRPEKMTIERVAINPPLEQRIFAMPAVPKHHAGQRATVTIAPPDRDEAHE